MTTVGELALCINLWVEKPVGLCTKSSKLQTRNDIPINIIVIQYSIKELIAMNPLHKTSSTIGRLVSKAYPQSNYICIQCRLRAISHLQKSAFSTSTPRKASNDKLPYSEKLRRRIWGTDTPPGQKDPYVRESPSDQSKTQQQDVSISDSSSEIDATTAEDVRQSAYVPATTWDGLEQIGGATGWWEQAWDQEHKFRG